MGCGVPTTVVPVRTVTSHPVTGDPPSLPGVQLRLTWPLPLTPTTFVGALGSPCGVTALEGAESVPAPKRLLARTWKVYVRPTTRLVNARLVAVRAIPVTVWVTTPPEVTTTS